VEVSQASVEEVNQAKVLSTFLNNALSDSVRQVVNLTTNNYGAKATFPLAVQEVDSLLTVKTAPVKVTAASF
jgi:hypothetical protein